MLELLTPTRFDRRMKNGRTGPLLLAAAHDDGREVEVIAKFSGPELGAPGLMREAMCAMVAADLGLPVPAPYLIRLEADFIGSVLRTAPDVATFLAASIPIGFGSHKLSPGYSAWMKDRPIPKGMLSAAVEIFAFDLLMQNPDRKPDHPNLEFRGEMFAIFDHELALITEGVLFWKPPWVLGALSAAGAIDSHVLCRCLKGRKHDLARLTGAWEAINDARLRAYVAVLPVEWTCEADTAGTAITFLKELRDNLRPAMEEVLRVLS